MPEPCSFSFRLRPSICSTYLPVVEPNLCLSWVSGLVPNGYHKTSSMTRSSLFWLYDSSFHSLWTPHKIQHRDSSSHAKQKESSAQQDLKLESFTFIMLGWLTTILLTNL